MSWTGKQPGVSIDCRTTCHHTDAVDGGRARYGASGDFCLPLHAELIADYPSIDLRKPDNSSFSSRSTGSGVENISLESDRGGPCNCRMIVSQNRVGRDYVRNCIAVVMPKELKVIGLR